jgi:hypothetical protein
MTFTVDNYNTTPATSWQNAVGVISTSGDGRNYVIKVTGSFLLDGVTDPTFDNSPSSDPTNIKVLIYSDGGPWTISLFNTGSLLRLGANQTVILRNITFKGKGSGINYQSLLYCSGANSEIVMYPGAVITENEISIGGGGVRVEGGGKLTMSGGVISKNKIGSSDSGAGVFVKGSGSTFEMNGGIISGNTVVSSGKGGGVGVQDNATFEMNGGVISGNTASSGGGSSGQGGGVFVGTETTLAKKFTMSGGVISGNTPGSTGQGGGVYVSYSNGASASGMSGGTISGNSALLGGGVCISNDGTFSMSGGAISGNEATGSQGGGVAVIANTSIFTMSGGAISGNKITGSSGLGGGVFMEGGYLCTFTMSGGTVYGNEAGVAAELKNTAGSGGSGAALYKTAGIAQWGAGIHGVIGIGGTPNSGLGGNIALDGNAQDLSLSTSP